MLNCGKPDCANASPAVCGDCENHSNYESNTVSNEDEVRAEFVCCKDCGSHEYSATLVTDGVGPPELQNFKCTKCGSSNPHIPLDAHSVQAARIAELEQQVALYHEDIERCWSHMPHLRNTEACYEVHEAVHELTRERDEARSTRNLRAQTPKQGE